MNALGPILQRMSDSGYLSLTRRPSASVTPPPCSDVERCAAVGRTLTSSPRVCRCCPVLRSHLGARRACSPGSPLQAPASARVLQNCASKRALHNIVSVHDGGAPIPKHTSADGDNVRGLVFVIGLRDELEQEQRLVPPD